MKRIGMRRYRCEDGETVTITFTPDPTDCIGKIIYDFLYDNSDPKRVEDNKIAFKFNGTTTLVIYYVFIPEQVDGICNVTLSGSAGGSSPDQIDYNSIPPDPIYVFVP